MKIQSMATAKFPLTDPLTTLSKSRTFRKFSKRRKKTKFLSDACVPFAKVQEEDSEIP